jgi:pimeloyl-ACP methyl ester carboxylesterase
MLANLLLAQASAGNAPQAVPRFETGECRLSPPDGVPRPDCGWLIVPEVRNNPKSKTLRLAVAVYRAVEPAQAPPILLLHDGPGGEGGIRASHPAFETLVRSALARSRDVVIFDMRGAGLSEPSMCPDFYDGATPAFNLRLPEERVRRYNDAVRSCAGWLKAAAIEPTAYSTEVNAADAIDLRRVLGYSQWDVLGISYGAQLAQALMALDGGAVNAVVMISPMTTSGIEAAEMAFTHQRALDRLFSTCAAQQECAARFPTLAQDFEALYEEFEREPLEVHTTGAAGPTTVWLDGARFVRETSRHLTVAAPPRLPLLVHELRRGDRASAAAAFVGDGLMRPYHPLDHLVGCNDYGADYPDAVTRIRPQLRAPFQSIADDIREHCNGWFDRLYFRKDLTVPGDIPTLMLNGEIDPYGTDWRSRQLAVGFTHAYVHDIRGRGHEPLGSCAQSIVEAFLREPSRAPDVSCIADVPSITFVTDDKKSGR